MKKFAKKLPKPKAEKTEIELRLAEQKRIARAQQKLKDIAQTKLFVKHLKEVYGLECFPEYQFHPERRWRIDFFFKGKISVGLEVEGGVYVRGRHTSPQGFLADIEKYNAFTERGIFLLRTTPKDLDIYKLYIEKNLLELLLKLLK